MPPGNPEYWHNARCLELPGLSQVEINVREGKERLLREP